MSNIISNTKLLTYNTMNDVKLITKEKVQEYILQASYSDNKGIKDDSLIFKEGYFDSMGFVLLITFIEDSFKVKIIDADLVEENFESINAIADFVLRKKQNQ